MATRKINEGCHYVKNDPHECKIKHAKFHFDILCRFGVIKESLPGRRNPPPGEKGLKKISLRFLKSGFYFAGSYCIFNGIILMNLTQVLGEESSMKPSWSKILKIKENKFSHNQVSTYF